MINYFSNEVVKDSTTSKLIIILIVNVLSNEVVKDSTTSKPQKNRPSSVSIYYYTRLVDNKQISLSSTFLLVKQSILML